MSRVKNSRVAFGGLLSLLVLIAIAPLTAEAQSPQVLTGVTAAGTTTGTAINPGVVPQGGLVAVPPVLPPPCSPQKMAEVRTPATPTAYEVRIDCSPLTLDPKDFRHITKRLIFERSDVTVEGNFVTVSSGFGTLWFIPDTPTFIVVIQSREYPDPVTGEPRWSRPANVTLRNLKIMGSVGIIGMVGTPTTTNEAAYVAQFRNNAPRNIVFDRVTITGPQCSDKGEKSDYGGACVPLYLFPGVSYFQMLNSEINGSDIRGTNIYLADMSYRNTFRNNIISGGTSHREAIAIDGSSENIIVNNHFQGTLNHGGIYLYRNCGEKNSTPHGTPSSNTIINNFFYYDKFGGYTNGELTPSIFVASRNGKGTSTYTCPPNFFDNARFNVVMQNQIKKLSPDLMITVDRRDVNQPNYINYNETVTAKIERKAGCYISNGYQKDFILDGEFINLFRSPNGEPVTTGYRYTCHDGVLDQSIDFAVGSTPPAGTASVR